MREVIVDGERFVLASDLGPIKIVVLNRGFVYAGRVSEVDNVVTIVGARSIIRWGTTKHLGELVNGPLENTRLGDRCHVKARADSQVIHTVEVNQDAWDKHAG